MQAASSISLAGVLPQASTSYLYSTGTCGCNTLFINVSTMEVVTTESNFPTCHIRTLDVSSWTSGRLTFLHGTQNQASKGRQAGRVTGYWTFTPQKTNNHRIARRLDSSQDMSWSSSILSPSHTIHGWYIHLHLVRFYGKCRYIYPTRMHWAYHYLINNSQR